MDFDNYELIRVWKVGGFKLMLYDTFTTAWAGKSRLAYRFFDKGRLIFEGDDFGCSPCHAIDSDAAVASLLVFLALQPGDTDREYFDSYTPEQLAWAEDRAEELSLYVIAMEEGSDA